MSSNQKKKKKTGNVAGLIAFGVVFFIVSKILGFFPGFISLPLTLILGTVFGLPIALIVRLMAQGLDTSPHGKQAEQEIKVEKAPVRQAQDVLQRMQNETGNAEVDEMLSRGREMIREIQNENDMIPDSSLSAKLDNLADSCSRIFAAVYEKPSKAGQIRKFMDYYLPTTLKMVKAYRTLGEKGISSVQVEQARNRIDSALSVVLDGCQKTLDNLYREDVLDMTTDIDVLEQMLKRDGLTESELEKAAQQAREAARIDAEAARIARENALRRQQAEAAMQEKEARTAEAVPTMEQYRTYYSRTDTGVSQRVANAAENARTHVSEAPTIYGGVYRVGENAGQAVAFEKENQ